MKILLNGYYGYDNAGDEAVLAAILEHIRAQSSDAEFLVTSGHPGETERLHSGVSVRALPRQNPQALLAALRECDLLVSGGGSLVQDVTSVRNVVYYAGLMRLAKLCRKPLMIYAQGVGPLHRKLSQKLARAGFQGARVITVRDEASKTLLQRIGVRRNIIVTADPVWALSQGKRQQEKGKTWCVALRAPTHGAEDFRAACDTIRRLAREQNARLAWLPMQQSRDLPLVQPCIAPDEEVISTEGVHPRDVLARCAACELMIAMRLHALIFAASQGVRCVAVNYDPKVEALAKMSDAPLLQNLSGRELEKLPAAVSQAQPLSSEKRRELSALATRNAQLAAAIL